MLELLATIIIGGATIEPEFAPYVNEFYERIGTEHKVPDVVFDEPLPGMLGDYSYGEHKVRIQKVTWVHLNDEERRWLIWHELGHSIGLGHGDEYPMEPALPKYLREVQRAPAVLEPEPKEGAGYEASS
jgi:hypothetical protein